MFEKVCNVVESWIVQLECLEESLDLTLCCGLSNGTRDVLYAMRLQVGCELASSILTVVLGSMAIAQDLSGDPSHA